MTAASQREFLITGAEELGVSLTPEQVDSIFLYLAELKKWNRKINLTAITGDRDIIIKHVLDSLSYIKGFTPGPQVRLLDMGSGAGFPAVPIKIAHPEISITLVESVKKKGAFLRHAIRVLNLTGAEVVDARTEELRDSYEASYHIVSARAFADIGSALASGSRFLNTGGVMILSRGPGETVPEQELSKNSVTLEKRLELTLPHSDYKRAVWVFRKIR